MNHAHHSYLWLIAQVSRLHGALASRAGQGMVEYALILALIAVVSIVILKAMGGHVSNTFTNIDHSLSAPSTSGQ